MGMTHRALERWESEGGTTVPGLSSPFSKLHTIQKYLPDHALEVMTAILLSFAGVATSWSGYQAALWSGIQAAAYNQATAMRLESTRASTEAGQLAIADVDLFIEWLNAYAKKDQKMADFYRSRFRPEFTQAFETWLASKPIHNPAAHRTPFKQPEYRFTTTQQASVLNEKAGELFKKGQEANKVSDNYVLNTVLLATVMFLCSIAQQFKGGGPRLVLLAVASSIAAIGVLNFLNYPLARA